ncbi:MAG: type II toxin-antitoxin system RelB/DinJ family antitoxin [Alphaproteobacteria bacterium]|nr:type II toxin-antitoxin system RelB/DinJ family antitoxin [Alphaproteobacteria bacterium]MCL2504953.1 type II toxin-antitoxin system RelB/DinJ family antitoxin [Alphaproteobacteria bacterium]
MLGQINIKIEAKDKRAAEAVLSDIGLSMSDAVRAFLKKVIATDGIPFDLRRSSKPNAMTLQAMKDIESDKGLTKLKGKTGANMVAELLDD